MRPLNIGLSSTWRMLVNPFNHRNRNGSRWAVTNIRSICNKYNDFVLFLASENPDIICVTETWLHPDVPDSLFCPNGYNIIRQDRNGRGGGVSFFLSVTVLSFQQFISLLNLVHWS